MQILILQLLFWASVAGVLYTYLGYPILLTVLHPLVRRRPSNPDPHFEPPVSVVLAAYNEANHIRRKLENCLALEYPQEKLEILVGSDGSEDATAEIAQQFTERGVKVFPFKSRQGKMATVNRLVAQATGEVCVFSDISELFDQDAVRKLVQHFADPQIGAVTGNHVYFQQNSGLGTGTRFYWKFQRFLQRVESRLYTVCQCDGTIYACRRALYVPPQSSTINDDVAVPLGIIGQGRRVIFEPQAIARGEVLKQTHRFFRQKIRSQAGRYQIFAQFPWMFWPLYIRRFWIFVSHFVMPVLVPWLLVVALLSNLLLARTSTLYGCFGVCQLLIYGLALVGLFAERFRINVPGTAIPFYFVTANVGSLVGFWAYITGTQRVSWRKVE